MAAPGSSSTPSSSLWQSLLTNNVQVLSSLADQWSLMSFGDSVSVVVMYGWVTFITRRYDIPDDYIWSIWHLTPDQNWMRNVVSGSRPHFFQFLKKIRKSSFQQKVTIIKRRMPIILGIWYFYVILRELPYKLTASVRKKFCIRSYQKMEKLKDFG